METTFLEEKQPNLIVATYKFLKGLFTLIIKTFFVF